MKRFIAASLCLVLALTALVGCTTKPKDDTTAKNPAVADIWKDIEAKLEADEKLPGMQDLDKDMLMEIYGVNADDLDEYTAKIAMINVQADEFFIAKVKDGKMDAVKEGITKRHAALDEQWKQYLPEVYEQVKAAVITTNGNYVMFSIGAGSEDALKIFNEKTK